MLLGSTGHLAGWGGLSTTLMADADDKGAFKLKYKALMTSTEDHKE